MEPWTAPRGARPGRMGAPRTGKFHRVESLSRGRPTGRALEVESRGSGGPEPGGFGLRDRHPPRSYRRVLRDLQGFPQRWFRNVEI